VAMMAAAARAVAGRGRRLKRPIITASSPRAASVWKLVAVSRAAENTRTVHQGDLYDAPWERYTPRRMTGAQQGRAHPKDRKSWSKDGGVKQDMES
jgi:hypothetical protein